MFESVLTFAIYGAAITATLVGAMIAGRFLLIPYLLLRYDMPIQKLESDFEKFKKQTYADAVGRGITAAGLAPHIAGPERIKIEKVVSLELRRRHFLDRANLFLSMSSFR